MYENEPPLEFATEYSLDEIDRACDTIGERIAETGSLSNYLYSIECTQARDRLGRAELLRMKRVSHFIASPDAPTETQESEAFYKGALFASALLQELHPEKEFTGGTLLHNYLWNELDQEIQSRELSGLPFSKNSLAVRNLAETLQFDGLTWAAEETESVEDYRQFAYTYFPELYKEDSAYYHMALAGFWTPIQELYEPAAQRESEGVLAYVNEQTAHVEETFAHNAHAEPDYIPTNSELADIIGDVFEKESYHSLKRETERINKQLRKLRGETASIEFMDDEAAKYAIRHLQEGELNALNRNNELIQPDDLIHVTGSYFCIVTEEDDVPTEGRIPKGTTVMGIFDSIAVIEAPSMRKITNENAESYLPEKIPTAALILQNPTFMSKNEAGESIIKRTDNTTIAVPLVHSAHISRVE